MLKDGDGSWVPNKAKYPLFHEKMKESARQAIDCIPVSYINKSAQIHRNGKVTAEKAYRKARSVKLAKLEKLDEEEKRKAMSVPTQRSKSKAGKRSMSKTKKSKPKSSKTSKATKPPKAVDITPKKKTSKEKTDDDRPYGMIRDKEAYQALIEKMKNQTPRKQDREKLEELSKMLEGAASPIPSFNLSDEEKHDFACPPARHDSEDGESSEEEEVDEAEKRVDKSLRETTECETETCRNDTSELCPACVFITPTRCCKGCVCNICGEENEQ